MMKIRYTYINFAVHQIYIKLGINSYPLDMLDVFSYYKNCRVVSYSEHMKKANLSYTEMINFANSKEGCTVYNNKKYLIFYNDLVKPYERQYWTLAHELGHIILGHLEHYDTTKIFRSSLSNTEYGWMEGEAHYFASQLLANNLILKELNIKNYNQISKLFKLSIQASKNKFNDLKKYLKFNFKVNNQDKIILNQFKQFTQTTICLNCGHKLSKNLYFCPICGEFKFERMANKMIYDKGFELDSNSRAIKCPKCNNENLSYEGDFCNICGTYLVNKCTQIEYDINGNPYDICGTLASGNARYCITCGSKTTFFENGLLEDYKIEKQMKELLEKDIPF